MENYTLVTIAAVITAARSFLRALFRSLRDSLGSLDFWHGMKWKRVTEEECTYMNEGIESWLFEYYLEKGSRRKVKANWATGKVTYDGKSSVRLGKVFNKLRKDEQARELAKRHFGCSLEDLIKQFENRQVNRTWDCVFTTSPTDVWGMSFEKGWTSCTSPTGCYHKGVYTDLLAGSGVIYFFTGKKDTPAGREVLRPAVDADGKPMIVRTGTMYGSGPKLTDEELTELFGIKVKTTHLRGKGLAYGIYDDAVRAASRREDDPDLVEEIREAFAPYCLDPDCLQAQAWRKRLAREMQKEDFSRRTARFEKDSSRRAVRHQTMRERNQQNIASQAEERPEGNHLARVLGW